MPRSDDDDMVILELHVHAETQKALLLSDTGDEKDAQWTPKSQMSSSGANRGKVCEIGVREWIAKDRGWI